MCPYQQVLFCSSCIFLEACMHCLLFLSQYEAADLCRFSMLLNYEAVILQVYTQYMLRVIAHNYVYMFTQRYLLMLKAVLHEAETYESQGMVVPCIQGLHRLFSYSTIVKEVPIFNFQFQFNSTSTNTKVKITMKINPYQNFDVI